MSERLIMDSPPIILNHICDHILLPSSVDRPKGRVPRDELTPVGNVTSGSKGGINWSKVMYLA